MAAKLRKCPFCSTSNPRDAGTCSSCGLYVIDIMENSIDDITEMCRRYINSSYHGLPRSFYEGLGS